MNIQKRAAPPGRCHSCNISETPEWRRGPDGARTLCNACGLREHPQYIVHMRGVDVNTAHKLTFRKADSETGSIGTSQSKFSFRHIRDRIYGGLFKPTDQSWEVRLYDNEYSDEDQICSK
ncbi:hypothetical protein BC938DRAFT_471141 [Jimgerdemannia flammicorona]|uniref:GATA-type domain-containing protein n=1 Tax=Jimgerdemannia flammicorona TaxID=994334 RepID=A0A433Q8U3_9FUNG|nr:hypothetical protein BC938DRAFT_471141 [Jimgerdemannia flammicorona]